MFLFPLHTTAADTLSQRESQIIWGLIYTKVLRSWFTQMTKKMVFSPSPCGI